MDFDDGYFVNVIENVREELTEGGGGKEDDNFVVLRVLNMEYVLEDVDEGG